MDLQALAVQARSSKHLLLRTQRPVTRGASPHEKIFVHHWKMCWTNSLTLLHIRLKIWAPLRKLFAPPGVPSWLRACVRSIKLR